MLVWVLQVADAEMELDGQEVYPSRCLGRKMERELEVGLTFGREGETEEGVGEESQGQFSFTFVGQGQ